MDPERKKFGRGPRELNGAVDLVNQYKLLLHHDFFCNRSLPTSISDTRYLHNVVGDTKIRKGEGMKLDQLFQNDNYMRETRAQLLPFDIETLGQAFQLRERAPVDLPSEDRGIPALSGKLKHNSKDKDQIHKKHKDKDKDKVKEHKRHKHHHKDQNRNNDREKRNEKSGHNDFREEHTKMLQHKKRKHGSN